MDEAMRRDFILFAVFISAIFFVLLFFLNMAGRKSSYAEIISPIANSVHGLLSFYTEDQTDAVQKAVEKVLADKQGEYSVVFKNLKTGETYMKNEHKVYMSASLYKLWVMSAVYDRIERGRFSKEEVFAESIQALNDKFEIASDEAEMTEGDITLTVNDALEKMIVVSDNYSALLLSSKVGLSTVKAFLKAYHFNESKLDPPQTTAYDIAIFYEKLYKGEVINKDASYDMLERLKRQQLNDRLPKYLPDNVKVAHKTGELDGVKHDAGIIFSEKGDYILVVLSDTAIPAKAAETIAEISREVYKVL